MGLSRRKSAPPQERRLQDLISVGPAMLRDFELLGIRRVEQLARANPQSMYKNLCRLTGQQHDICCQDVFSAAVAQARDPRLPVEQCVWWYWSRKRKAERAGT
jgi:predicted RecB family nuclease